MPTDMKGKIVAIDFDSTISHCPAWKGVGVFGKPIVNAKWALERLKDMGALVVIYTTRREIPLVAAYMKENDLPYDYINFSPRNVEQKLSDKKIAADIYIDDRNIAFRGEWKDTFLEAVNFKRWEKKDQEKAISK